MIRIEKKIKNSLEMLTNIKWEAAYLARAYTQKFALRDTFKAF